jgi:hypothetical protein
MIFYEWSEEYKYYNNSNVSFYYPGYPQRWSMVSEPGLDNAYYPPYNITKNFATYHSAGSMVVKSNSSLGSIKVVASKRNDSQYITVINTGANASVSLNISGNICIGIKDLESGENYTLNNGIVQIGAIGQYGIRYFVNLNISTVNNSNISENISIPLPQQNETPQQPAPNMTQNQTTDNNTTQNNLTQNQTAPGGSLEGGGKGKNPRVIPNVSQPSKPGKSIKEIFQKITNPKLEYNTTKIARTATKWRYLLAGQVISEDDGKSNLAVKLLLFSFVLSVFIALILAIYIGRVIRNATNI